MDIANWLAQYGLFAVPALLVLSGTGLPVSEDLILLTAGWLSVKGELPARAVVAVALPAVLISDQILYSLARAGRRSTRVRAGWAARAAGRLAAHGMLAVFVARFVAMFRAPVFVLVGLGGLPRARFLAADAAAAAISVPLMVWLGSRFGPALADALAPFVPWIAAAALVLVIAVMITRRLKRRA